MIYLNKYIRSSFGRPTRSFLYALSSSSHLSSLLPGNRKTWSTRNKRLKWRRRSKGRGFSFNTSTLFPPPPPRPPSPWVFLSSLSRCCCHRRFDRRSWNAIVSTLFIRYKEIYPLPLPWPAGLDVAPSQWLLFDIFFFFGVILDCRLPSAQLVIARHTRGLPFLAMMWS